MDPAKRFTKNKSLFCSKKNYYSSFSSVVISFLVFFTACASKESAPSSSTSTTSTTLQLIAPEAPAEPSSAIVPIPPSSTTSTTTTSTTVPPTPAPTPTPAPPSTTVAIQIPSGPMNLGRPLTKVGKNETAEFSPDGQKVLFISSLRESHKQRQIYELNLDNFSEKRISHQGGDCYDPIYSKDGQKVIFASTTDELKERPVAIYGKASDLPQTEIYLSDLKGLNTVRLTTAPGNQSHLSWKSDKEPYLVLSSQEGDFLQLALLHMGSYKLKNFVTIKQKNLTYGLYNSKNLALWIQAEKDSNEKYIYWTKQIGKTEVKPLLDQKANFEGLTWYDANKESILFSANLDHSTKNSIYFYDLQNRCWNKILEGEFSLLSPKISPDKKRIIFTVYDQGASQIYIRDTADLKFACDPTPPNVR